MTGYLFTGVSNRRARRPIGALALAVAVALAGGLPAKSASVAAADESGGASEDEATALAARVAVLIERLDASRLADRDAAEKALVALGPGALDVLPQGDKNASAEVKQRLARVRRQLELAAAKSAAKASLITLSEAERPLSEILAALAEQSGNPLVDGRAEGGARPGDPRIRLGFDKTPFWQALDRTLDAAGCSVRIRDASGDEPLRLVVVARGEGERPRGERAEYQGPLRFALADIDAKRDAAGNGGLLRVVLETAWEPRLRPISFTLSAGDLTAADDTGRPLAVATPQAEWSTASLGGQSAIRLSLPLAKPADDAKAFSLKGRVTALLPGANVAFRFEKLAGKTRGGGAAVAAQTIGDATVRLESFRRQDDRWQARFRVIYASPQEAVQSHFDWLYTSRAAMMVGSKRVAPVRYDAQAAEDGVVATYEFAAGAGGDAGGEMSLVYTTPAVILSLPYRFEFRDVLLGR
jgi:hypothetical protein